MKVSAKQIILLLSGIIPMTPLTASENMNTYIPNPHSIDRYSAMWSKSPFSVASVVVQPVNNSQWLMTGMLVFDETPLVTLTNRDTLETISLSPGESQKNVNLVSAEWSNESEGSFAVISINGANKRISFDEKSLALLAARNAPKLNSPVKKNIKNIKKQPTKTIKKSNPPNVKRVTRPRRIIRPSS